MLTSARQCVEKSIQKAQKKYKTQYDKTMKAESPCYKMGRWILIRHPQEESGPNRKLSRPWYGPFRITGVEKTGVTAERVYGNSAKNQIIVHLQRVTRCPPAFPAGCYWYGDRCNGPGCLPKWIDDFVKDESAKMEIESDEEHGDQPNDDDDDGIEDRRNDQLNDDGIEDWSKDQPDGKRTDAEQDKLDDGKYNDGIGQTKPKPKGSKANLMVPSRARTRDVRPPTRYRS